MRDIERAACGTGAKRAALAAAGSRRCLVIPAEAHGLWLEFLVSAYRSRFPHAPVRCGAVESSDFFGRTFVGVLAVGLMFLQDGDVQRILVGKVAGGWEADRVHTRPDGSMRYDNVFLWAAGERP